MKFWILESNQIDDKVPYELIDFPQITEEMYEEGEHEEILETDLKERDLDSFSSWFTYDIDRMYDENGNNLEESQLEEAKILLKAALETIENLSSGQNLETMNCSEIDVVEVIELFLSQYEEA